MFLCRSLLGWDMYQYIYMHATRPLYFVLRDEQSAYACGVYYLFETQEQHYGYTTTIDKTPPISKIKTRQTIKHAPLSTDDEILLSP